MQAAADGAVPYLRTGCTLLDLMIGGGMGLGFPAGRVLNFVGDKSAGKTFNAIEMIAKNHHDYGKRFKYNYDDSESGCTLDGQALFGIDITTPDTVTSSTVEEMDANVGKFLKKLRVGDIGLYVVDSLDGLSDNDKEERADKRIKQLEAGKQVQDDGSYGMGAAKFLSQEFFKSRTDELLAKNCSLLLVSQVRENINAGMYGKKHKRNGGKALDFYAHTVVWFAGLSKIVKNGRVVGVVTHAKTEKSKTPRPYRECVFSILFDYGIDNVGSNIDYLFDLRGERGDLLSSAKAIPWDAKKENNLTNLTEWLKAVDWYEEARFDKKEETGKPNLSRDWILEWVELEPARKQAYEKVFGTTLTRDQLVELIEASPELQTQLEQRVIQKWEEAESAISSNRKRKYSC
jgi:RecA/RadA recombinase